MFETIAGGQRGLFAGWNVVTGGAYAVFWMRSVECEGVYTREGQADEDGSDLRS